MANVVKIELTMDESGAVTGFRTLDGAATKVQTTIKAIGPAGTAMGTQVSQGANVATKALQATAAAATQVGTAAHAAGAKGSAAMQQVGSHTLTSLDSVRLFRDEFGIHIPRSMEKAMASSTAVMGVLSAMQGPMLAVGAIGIGVALGKQIYDVWEKLTDLDDTVLKFNEDLSKTAHTKFMDTSSIEDTRDQIKGLSVDLQLLTKQKGQIGQSITKRIEDHMYDLNPIGAVAGVVKDGKKLDKIDASLDQTQVDLDTQQRNSAKQFHEQRMRDIEVESKKASSIQNEAARATKEASLAKERNSETSRYTSQQSEIERVIDNRTRDVGHQVLRDPNSGQAELQSENAVADAEKYAKLTEYERQEADEVRKIQREANNESLKGYQLLEAQRIQAREDFVRKYGASTTALSAIDNRYYEEEKKASDDLTRELERNARDAKLAGLTGIGQIQQRSDNKDADVDADLKSGKFSAFGDQAEQQAAADRLKAANHKQALAEITSDEQRFADSIDAISDASAQKQVQGFARIKAEGSKQLDDLQRKFEETYGKMQDKSSLTYQFGVAEKDRGAAAINQGTDSQIAQLAQKNAEETSKIQAEANRSALPQMKQHQQEIIDAYNERTEAYRRMLADQEISQSDFDKRTAAAAQQMNAQLAADAKAQRDKIASELEPFMGAHPLQALEKFGEKQASQFAANAYMHVTGGGDPGIGGGKKGSVLDLFRSNSNKPGAHPGTPGAAGASAVQSMTLNATSVTLYAQSATFAGGGAASGPGAPTSAGLTAATSSPALRSMAAGSSAAMTDAGTFGQGSSATFSDSTVTGSGSGASGTSAQAGIGAGISGGINSTMQMGQSAQQLGVQLFGKNGPTMANVSKVTGTSSGTLGKIGGAAGAGAGLFSAFEGNGGVGGALSGAMSGAQLGGEFGGPIGMAIGAVAGGLMGLLGFGGADKAKKYDKYQVRPHIAATELAFEMGTMPYQAAYDDLAKLDLDAAKQSKAWGSGGEREYRDHIKKEILAGQAKLEREQKAGRSQFGMTAGQFDSGGLITGFGDYATTANQGFIHAKLGETVMHQGATDTHGDALALMLGGANRKQMAGYYGAKEMAPTYNATMQHAANGGSGQSITNNYGHTIHAIDVKSFNDALMNSKHGVRGAVNASYAENSGGADYV